MEYVLLNNEILDRNKTSVDIEDRAHQFGDGIYEVAAVYEGKTFKMKEHMERLKYSAEQIRLPLPYNINVLMEKLEELKLVNNLMNGLIYVQISRGASRRIHNFPEGIEPQLIGYTIPISRPSKEVYDEGVPVRLVEDVRWLRCNIKSLNLLPNVLAKQEAIDYGCYEAVLYRNGIITEGSSTNVFSVKEGRVYTHPANQFILNGITRTTILDICKNSGIEVIEKEFDLEFFLSSDEAFLTGTYIDVVPINQINDVIIKPGNVTKRILAELESQVFQ